MKPIPENRRWQEERAKHPDGLPPPPPEESILIVLGELPVIPARYAGICQACGRVIQPGMPITRHAHLPLWVHQECRNTAVERAGIPARYPGVCRACRRTIQVGELITRHATRGWIHLSCAQTPAASNGNPFLANIDEIIEQLLDLDDLLDDWEEEDVG